LIKKDGIKKKFSKKSYIKCKNVKKIQLISINCKKTITLILSSYNSKCTKVKNILILKSNTKEFTFSKNIYLK